MGHCLAAGAAEMQDSLGASGDILGGTLPRLAHCRDRQGPPFAKVFFLGFDFVGILLFWKLPIKHRRRSILGAILLVTWSPCDLVSMLFSRRSMLSAVLLVT